MSKCFKLLLISLTFIASLSLISTLFFYVWQLANLQLVLATIFSIALTWWLTKNFDLELVESKKSELKTSLWQKINHWSLSILYLLLSIKIFLWLSTFTTSAAIRSPWEVIPSHFFILYFILTLLLIFIILISKGGSAGSIRGRTLISEENKGTPALSSRTSRATGNLLLISIHFLLTYSLVNIIYSINFGFDPFIHQASEKLLATTGTISPKPLLYIGQYSLVLWLSKISSISLILIDKWLVPVLASFFLPATIFFALTKGFNFKTKTALLSILAFPIFLLPFYFSVPQNLANLFLLITILLSITLIKQKDSMVPFARKVPKLFLWILGFLTFTIHPFSGIPLLIYLTIYTLLTQQKIRLSRKKLISILIIIILLGLVALPLALSIGSGISNNIDVSISSYELPVTSYQFASWVPFYSIFHLVYLFKLNHVLILAILAATGLWIILKINKGTIKPYPLRERASIAGKTLMQENNKGARAFSQDSSRIVVFPFVLVFLIISINVSLLNLIKLPIISYEIAEFTNRFWQIGLLFLIPIILYAIAKLINLIMSERDDSGSIREKTLKFKDNERLPALSGVVSRVTQNLFIIFFITLLSTTSLYLTYPRNDAFTKGRSFATSESDIVAVNWIELDAGARDYVVLANQAVSAAALQEFGFKKYYPNQLINQSTNSLFFYPIPTTSPLYELYLDMVYQAPTKKRLEQALDLTGAYNAYFVINDYWLDFEKIVEQAKLEFPDWQVIHQGKIYIFKQSK